MDGRFLPLNKEDFNIKELKNGTTLVLLKVPQKSTEVMFSGVYFLGKMAMIITPKIINHREINHIPQTNLLTESQ